MKSILIATLVTNGVLALAYRALRHRRGGPLGDVYGGLALLILLSLTAVAMGAGLEGARWVALAYALLFGLVVVPIWILAVVIPARPDGYEYVLVGGYWVTLLVIAAASLAL